VWDSKRKKRRGGKTLDLKVVVGDPLLAGGWKKRSGADLCLQKARISVRRRPPIPFGGAQLEEARGVVVVGGSKRWTCG